MATAKDKSDSLVETPVSDVVEPTRTRKVVIQRPAGNSDIGQSLGFNGISGVYPFDTPVDLPADMVDFFRAQRQVEFRAGEDGKPVASYYNLFNIVDA